MSNEATLRTEASSRRVPSTTMIAPSAGGPFAVAVLDLRDAIARHSLWLHQGWVDVVHKYRRTRIGPLWHTLSLGIFIISMGTIYSVIFKIDPVKYFRDVTVNLIVWTLVSSAIIEGTGHFVAGQATALSMRFPYFAFTFALTWRGLLMFGHHLILYVLIAVATLLVPSPAILLALPALALVLLNCVWLSTLAGIACLRFRDLSPAIASGMQVLMFVTPVFWSIDMLGAKLAFIAELNPLYHLVVVLRDPFLGRAPAMDDWLWAGGSAVVGWLVAFWIYGRYRDRFAYWY
jgi:ABC-2 type transport system permease protein